jgi:hypothetical protein
MFVLMIQKAARSRKLLLSHSPLAHQFLTLNSKLLSLNSLTSQSLCAFCSHIVKSVKPRAFSVVSYSTTALYSHATAFVTIFFFFQWQEQQQCPREAHNARGEAALAPRVWA